MRISWRTEWIHWLLLLGMFGLSAALWSGVPERVPVHWSLAGRPDRWGGRAEGLLIGPLVGLALYLLLLVLPRLDPGRANYRSFAGAYATLRLALLAVIAGIHVFVLLAARGVPVRVETWMPLLVGALFVVLGNLLGKLRPNWFVGIRTPWTLSSKDSWDRTHRVGGRVFMLLGALLMGSAAIHVPRVTVAIFVLGALGVLGLIVYSYVIWRGDPEKTPPSGTLPADREP